MPRSLGSQLFFAMWGLALVLIAAAVAGSVSIIDGFVHQDVKQTLAASRVGFAKYLRMQRALMARVAESAAAIPMLKATLGIEGLDRETASVAADMVREFADVGFCILQNPEGTVLASTLSATDPGPSIGDEAWLVALNGLPQIIARAEVTSGNERVGRLILGRAIDHEFAGDISELTGSEAFVLFEGRLIANSELGASSAPTAAEIDSLRSVEVNESKIVGIGDVSCFVTTIPLPAGTSIVLARRVDGLTALRRELMWIVAVGALIGGLLALGAARLVATRIARPIRALREASERFARGDTESTVAPSGSQETRALGVAFNEMVRDLDAARAKLVKAERLAAIGQITVTMNHEMNNPLQGLLSTVEMALRMQRENPDSAELREVLETIQETSLQLNRVLRRISSLTDDEVTNYAGDISMIDIHRTDA